ncbi:MAG: IS200/IS605 family accessory protein TnpB-related protein [Promethearchaeota archaeon]
MGSRERKKRKVVRELEGPKKKVEITIPGYLYGLSEKEQAAIGQLLQKFGNARRHAYQLARKQVSVPMIEKTLQEKFGLNGRYSKDAYYSIKDLPSHVTFGGLKNQQLREKGKITAEEYKKRRNSIVLSRGEKTKQGNLNMRLNPVTMTLRINVGQARQYITPKIYIAPKYLKHYGQNLDGSVAYTVLIKRRDKNAGFDVRITVTETHKIQESTRAMALDVNAGHTDFAVLDKQTGEVVTVGVLDHYETQYFSKRKRRSRLYQLTQQISQLADQYDAEVVIGKMQTSKVDNKPKSARRKIRQMPQYQFRQILDYKLPMAGTNIRERSEAYTSIGGKVLSQLLGLDVHKCAAILFGLKFTDYDLFSLLVKFLRRLSFNDGNGSLRTGTKSAGTKGGLTALSQNGRIHIPKVSGRVRFWLTMMLFWEFVNLHDSGDPPAIPGTRGLFFFQSLKSPLLAVRKI